MTLTIAQQEALYDLTRLSPVIPVNPELPRHLLALRAQIDAEVDPSVRKRLIFRLADQVLAQPAILDVATARQRALVDWKGTTKICPSGALRRSPVLPDVKIGQLEDGTPVIGDFDTDDAPLCALTSWEGFSIIASADGFELADNETGKDFHHLTVDQWNRLKTLVNSNVVDQALRFGQAWEAQRAI